MSCFVYILYSPEHARTYAGQTNDVESRLRLHNAGRVKSTKAFRPWTLIHTESFRNRSEAIQREEWLKTVTGRKFITKLLEKQIKDGGLSDPAMQDRDLVPTSSERTKPL